ncbi:MAG: alanine racemase [Burkholderiaceae bacterium]|nr:alanine racemase [Burkholderiaceae bacterium]
MSRPTRCIVSTAALRHNLEVARRHAPGAGVWAVVKADAYGHGIDAALSGFDAADGWALLEWDKAIEIRARDPARPILMLEGCFCASDVARAARYRLDIVVHEETQIDWIARTSPSECAGLRVWLKRNSGMNRLGFDPGAFEAARERLQTLEPVENLSFLTHFANADRAGAERTSVAEFAAATPGANSIRSAANSAAVLSMPDASFDWIRPGIMLYGASPFGDRSAASLGLLPAMRLESTLIAVRTIAAGACVGYGSTYVAPRPMRIGVVACGYADGYPRHAPNGTPVLVDGSPSMIAGRVSMDMLTVDLDRVPTARIGSRVELWGDHIPVDTVAGHAGTIGYELLCAISSRVPRTTVDSVLLEAET